MTQTAIILAGGLGTRLREIVADRPKPMALIAGRPFLAHQITYWRQQGIKRFILSVGYKHEMIVDYFGQQYEDANIEYVIEHAPLGTGGGLLNVIKSASIDGGFLLLNGDTYFKINLQNMCAFATLKNADLMFALFATNDCARYMGIEIEPSHQVSALNCKYVIEQNHFASGGVYFIKNKTIFANFIQQTTQKLSLETDIIPKLQKLNYRLFGHFCDNDFIDIGIPDDYLRAEQIII